MFVNLELAVEGTLDKVNGPAHGFIALANAIHCRLDVSRNKNEVSLISDDAGRSIDLLPQDLPLLKWNLRDFATRSILAGLIKTSPQTTKATASARTYKASRLSLIAKQHGLST